MIPALLLAGSLAWQPGVPDVDQVEFTTCLFVFDAHGRNAAAIGSHITVLVDNGQTITAQSQSSWVSNLRVVSAELFIDGRIPMTRVTVQVSPRQYRYLALAQKKGRIIIVPPPPMERSGGIDRTLPVE